MGVSSQWDGLYFISKKEALGVLISTNRSGLVLLPPKIKIKMSLTHTNKKQKKNTLQNSAQHSIKCSVKVLAVSTRICYGTILALNEFLSDWLWLCLLTSVIFLLDDWK